MTHRGSRNQQAACGGVFPTQTKRAVGLGEPAGAGLPEKPGQKAAGPEPGTLRPDAAACPLSHPPRRCLAASPLGSGAKHAGDAGCGRARDAPAAPPPWPGGPQPGLQHLPVDPHPKPRAQGQGGPAGGRGSLGWAPPGPSPALSPCWLCWSQFWKRRGGMGRRAQGSPASGGNQKGRLSVALSPRLKLPVGMPRQVQWFRRRASLQRARLRSSARN